MVEKDFTIKPKIPAFVNPQLISVNILTIALGSNAIFQSFLVKV